jgi:hypothetical protein
MVAAAIEDFLAKRTRHLQLRNLAMTQRGFALVLSLFLLLLLTIFGFSLLLLASSYFRSAKNLTDNQKARLVCEQATRYMVDRHNMDPTSPRFFFDPQSWTQGTMVPFQWQGHEIAATFQPPWNASGPNALQVSASRGRFRAYQTLNIRQRRLEDFALYTNASLQFAVQPLFDGLVYSAGNLDFLTPVARFRELAQAGNISPSGNVSFRRMSLQRLDYPALDQFLGVANFFSDAQQNGLIISNANPLFWKGNHYELNLDLLQIARSQGRWQLHYNGADLGLVSSLHLWFDDHVYIQQSFAAMGYLPTGKPQVPLYISSSSDVTILSNLQKMFSQSAEHPLFLFATDALYLSSALPRAATISAGILVLGTDPVGATEYSVLIQPGGTILSTADKQIFLSQIRDSAFVVEPQKRNSLIQSLQNDGKIVWFRGSLLTAGPLQIPPDLEQLHFQASCGTYPLLPSFPFVFQEESSRRWQ